MTVRPPWWAYAIALVVFTPAFVMAGYGEWFPLLVLLAPGLVMMLVFVVLMAMAWWRDRTKES